MGDELRRLATEARKRAVGGILGEAENSGWWERLSAAEQNALREKVRTAVGAYHDLVLDMIKVTGTDTLVNQETLRLVQLLHASAQEVRSG